MTDLRSLPAKSNRTSNSFLLKSNSSMYHNERCVFVQEESPDAEGRGGKIVVYMTSLSAVRDTYGECRKVVLMLRGHRVSVQQKDIMLHDEYHKELKERLDDETVTVPQVFINGHHIGVSQSSVLFKICTKPFLTSCLEMVQHRLLMFYYCHFRATRSF